MAMKSFRGPRWTLQCYWPSLYRGPSSFGIKCDTALVFTRYHGGARAVGVALLGFGLGVLLEPVAAGQTLPAETSENVK